MAIIDARALPDASRVEADLVIIGGGLAGITLGKELAGGPLKVAILESGGLEIDMENQALYAGSGVQTRPATPTARSTTIRSSRVSAPWAAPATSGAASADRWTRPTSPSGPGSPTAAGQ